MEYRRGTRIVMDEDKIKREGIYDLENIYKDKSKGKVYMI